MDTTRSFVWKRLACSGNGDELYHRSGFSATLVGGSIWVVGGLRMRGRLSVLDMQSLQWQNQLLSDRMIALQFHGATLLNDTIVIFGMRHETERRVTNLHALDVVSKECRLIPTFNKAAMPEYRVCNAVQHYARGNKLVVLGKAVNLGGVTQLRLLNLSTWNWEAPQTKGVEVLLDRRPTVQSCISGSRFWVYTFGYLGSQSRMWFIDLDGPNKFAWTELLCGRNIKRFTVSLTYMGHGRFVIYGGNTTTEVNPEEFALVENANGREPSLHVVKNQKESSEYVFSGDVPIPRDIFKVLKVQDRIFMLGGTNNDRSNFYVLSAG